MTGIIRYRTHMPANQTLGERVIEGYEKAPIGAKRPNGSCFGVVYRRVQAAARAHCDNTSLPSLKAFRQFDRLWGSKYDPKNSWLKYSSEYRAKGPPGAMASQGWGTLVEQAGIWTGGLTPGAVIQVWFTEEAYTHVHAGTGGGVGHAFIFRKYVNTEVPSDGMLVADQGYLTRDNLDRVVLEGTFPRWFAANIRCPG